MALGEGWQIGIAIAVATLPSIAAASLGYYFNQRSKREQFEREQKFDRKRSGYERVLSALRKMKKASFWSQLREEQKTGTGLTPSVVSSLTKEDAASLNAMFREFLPAMALDSAFDVAAFLKDARSTKVPVWTAANDMRLSNLASIIRMSLDAMSELQNAIDALAILDIPTEIHNETVTLMTDLVGSEKPLPDFDTRIASIIAGMKEDLRRTMRSHHDAAIGKDTDAEGIKSRLDSIGRRLAFMDYKSFFWAILSVSLGVLALDLSGKITPPSESTLSAMNWAIVISMVSLVLLYFIEVVVIVWRYVPKLFFRRKNKESEPRKSP